MNEGGNEGERASKTETVFLSSQLLFPSFLRAPCYITAPHCTSSPAQIESGYCNLQSLCTQNDVHTTQVLKSLQSISSMILDVSPFPPPMHIPLSFLPLSFCLSAISPPPLSLWSHQTGFAAQVHRPSTEHQTQCFASGMK